ncbi:Panacea domain-containing protein [Parapedobacter indicus]|nr:Panacea domain-containing protein [Parapedobacter indicus]
MSKATKLLYLADEHAVRKTGAPILWLSYRVDVNGPLTVETFPTQLLRSPIKAFIDDEFSDCEINILQDIVDHYGRYTDKELVEILSREDTLWNRTKKTPGALIDFTQLLDTDYKKAAFEMAYEFQISRISLGDEEK